MQHFDSDLFGRLPQPQAVTEVLDLLAGTPSETPNVWMWRGQGDIAWPLHSTAYRRLLAYDRPVTESALATYEGRLLEQATHQGYRLVEGRELSDLELLARLRHYGAATRLMDFTRSAVIGLWFAAADKPDAVGLVVGFHSDSLGGYERQLDLRPYSRIMESIQAYEHPMTWEPPFVSRRVAAQHSQFLYSALSDAPRGSLRIAHDDNAIQAVAIGPELKPQLQEALMQSFDIRRTTLFPDVSGFALANAWDVPPYEMLRW